MKTDDCKKIALALLRFSVPLILGGVLQQLYLWADAFIVGHYLGEQALASVGITVTITECITLLMTGFTTGLSVIAAQRYGAGDQKTVRELFSGFLVIMVGAFLLLSVLGVTFTGELLNTLKTPDNIFDFSRDYLRIIFIGVPFLGAYNLFSAMLRAVGDSKSSFFAIIISSMTNVALDVWFVFGLKMGVKGAAIATIISQIVMTVFLAVYATQKHEIYQLAKGQKLFHSSSISLGLRYALPLMVQQSVTAVGNLILQGFMNGFGSHTVAAITSAYRVDSIMLLPMFNLGAATSTMVAQNKGAEDDERKRSFTRVGIIMTGIVSLVLTALMFNFGGNIVRIFGVEEEAAQIGRLFFRTISVYYLAAGLEVAFRAVIEGNGKVVYTTAVGISGLILRIAFSYLLAGIFNNMTIAHAEGMHWIFMLICFIPMLIKLSNQD